MWPHAHVVALHTRVLAPHGLDVPETVADALAVATLFEIEA